jgi:hypothetical protein
VWGGVCGEVFLTPHYLAVVCSLVAGITIEVREFVWSILQPVRHRL